jgi:L-fuculose-phosphate aldolase
MDLQNAPVDSVVSRARFRRNIKEWINDKGRKGVARGHRGQSPLDECRGTQSGHVRQHFRPLQGRPAHHGPLNPSTEWRFHLDITKSRPDVGAIVHTHSTYATVLAIARKEIPACHYMIAAFGGTTIRCAGYARYGTKELSELALQALEGRNGCLLANHGMLALGANLEKAMWHAMELETLARQYYLSLALGDPFILSDEQIAEAARGFATYGLRDAPRGRTAPKRAAGSR